LSKEDWEKDIHIMDDILILSHI